MRPGGPLKCEDGGMMTRTAERAAARGQSAERPRRRWVRFRLAYVFLLAVMALFTYAFLQKTQEIQRLSVEQAAITAQNQQIRADNNLTWRQNRYYRTRQYVMQAARASLGYTAPGERAIRVQFVPRPVIRKPPAPMKPVQQPRPVWQRWWDVFFR